MAEEEFNEVITLATYLPRRNCTEYVSLLLKGLSFSRKKGYRTTKTFLTHSLEDLCRNLENYLNEEPRKGPILTLCANYNATISRVEYFLALTHI